jgi:D-3-phosphoglycerate dehydrogenase
MWWAPGINKISVSELAICYMVFALRRIHFFSSVLYQGEWKGPRGFGGDLRGRTVGIHGVGHIGKEVVKLLQPYGVHILACDREDFSDFYKQFDNVEKVGAEELWARSDVLTIHLSKNQSTIGMYTREVQARLKPGMILVNCARGGMVDEAALADNLKSGHISGAAFDVFAVEPANNNPLLGLPNMFASPHIGATTMESWDAMLRSGIHGIEHAYEPKPGVYPFD